MIASYAISGRGLRAGPALPAVIGHRGAAARAPENTLAGFRRAKALGCSWVEFDVHLTADGALVLCHDPRLDRTTTGRGMISAQTLAAVHACDAGVRFDTRFAGERVPTFAEALDLAAELDLGSDIEVKSDRGREYATAAAVADMVRQFSGGRFSRCRPPMIASSFLPAALAALRELAPQLPRGILFGLIPRNWADIAMRLGCDMIGANHRQLSRRRVSAIRAAGYPLAAYTVNSRARARLLYAWGVTSVFSDAPDIILNSVAGRGPSLPAAASQIPAAARQGAFR